MNDFWNERYAEKEYAYGDLPNQFLKIQLDQLKAGHILFVCEGEGRNAVYAAQQNWQVEAFDLSEEGKKKALLLAEQNKVSLTYQIQDAATVSYPENSFDAVALIYAHFPVAIRQAVHHKIMHWLKPEGIVILEAFNPMQLENTSGGPKELSMLYTPEMVQNDFKYLSIQQLSMETISLNEGKYHRGKADVIRFVGKKVVQ
jgi:2-polyprenyl-3-methyl-5-hydroxy-6-metoxy-1,4-benzoquinol methylase